MINDYIPPTPEEMRRLLLRWGSDRKNKHGVVDRRALDGEAAGRIIATSGRRIRTYTSLKDPSKIPFSALYTLASECEGVKISPKYWRRDLVGFDCEDCFPSRKEKS